MSRVRTPRTAWAALILVVALLAMHTVGLDVMDRQNIMERLLTYAAAASPWLALSAVGFLALRLTVMLVVPGVLLIIAVEGLAALRKRPAAGWDPAGSLRPRPLAYTDRGPGMREPARRMKRHRQVRLLLLPLALATMGTLVPSAAQEEPHDWQLAVQANEVNEKYCANIYGANVDIAAEGYQAVAAVWADLDDGFERTQNPELQYWRGVLAQCLGQSDRAKTDLETFLESLTDDRRAALQAMVKDASKRIKRIERASAGTVQVNPERERGSGDLGLALSGGPAYGPLFSVHHEVHSADSETQYLTDSLLPAWGMHIAVGPEIVIAPPLLWTLQVGVALGYRQHTLVAAESMDLLAQAVVDDTMEPRTCLWLQARTGFGLLLAPQRVVSPVVRVALGYRMMPEWDYNSDYQPLAAWHVVSLGGFAGLVLDVTPSLGFEAGCWVSGDLVATQRLRAADSETIDNDLEATLEPLVVAGHRLSVWPGLSVRVLFGGRAKE